MCRILLLCSLFLFPSCVPDGNGILPDADTNEPEVVDTFSVHRASSLSDSDKAYINENRASADSIIQDANSLIVRASFDTMRNVTHVEEIELHPDVAASFPGGGGAMDAYILKKRVYPLVAFQNDIKGTVMVKAIVEKDGNLTAISVQRGIGYGCNEAAMDCVKGMPKWIPAKKSGVAVRSVILIPVSFGN